MGKIYIVDKADGMLIKFCVDHPRPVQGSRNSFEDGSEEWSLQLILNYTILLPLQQFSKLNFLVQIAFLFISSIRFTTQLPNNQPGTAQQSVRAPHKLKTRPHQININAAQVRNCALFLESRNETERKVVPMAVTVTVTENITAHRSAMAGGGGDDFGE